jgi:hypothetical protein
MASAAPVDIVLATHIIFFSFHWRLVASIAAVLLKLLLKPSYLLLKD